MICKIFCLVAMVTTAPLMIFFQEKMLTPDNNRNSTTERYLIFTGLFFQLGIVRVYAADSLLLVAAYGIYIIGTVWMLRRCYQEPILIKIVVWIILMGLSIVGDAILEGISFLLTGKVFAADYSQPETAFYCAMVLPITLILYIFTVLIWNKVYRKRQNPGNTGMILLFCALPVFIIVMGILTLSHASGTPADHSISLLCGALSFMSVMAIFMLFLQTDRAVAQRELADLQRHSELERAHYTAVEEKREALARIRHDYRNVLNAALILIEGGNLQKAKQLLTELTERIKATSEHPFCAIPVINAVLTEKKTICDRQGILLQPELLLPEILPVDDFDLCIILGNLIDNAIRACSLENERQELQATPEIRLSAGVVQGYLVVRCENPIFPGTEAKKGTGYGQKILKSLAEKYQGDFLIEKQDGQYTAQISLFLKMEKAGEIRAKTDETGNHRTS